MHKRKIEIADEIFAINKNGNISLSTTSEIEYATKTTNLFATWNKQSHNNTQIGKQ